MSNHNPGHVAKQERSILPEADSLVLTTCSEVTGNMRAPAESKTFLCVAQKFHLRVDCSCRQAGMLRTIPDHCSSIRTHGGNDIRILRLITCLVDFTLVINLLNNVELNLHWGLLGATPISANLAPFLIVVIWVRSRRVGKLHMGDLQIILCIARSVCSN